MSIFGAMFSGVTGLDAQSQALGMIADNISNINTVGYKGVVARFSTLVTQQASRTNYTPGGVQTSPLQHVDRQGLLQSSSSRTDIAIAGAGFFVVNEAAAPGPGNEFLFTRAGSFTPDQNGDLRNTAGYYLQGWPLINGALPSNTSVLTSVSTVNISNLAGTAQSTSSVNLALNLPSTANSQTGGGQINSAISSSTLGGIVDINYNSFGTLGNVATLTYNNGTNIMTIDIAGQTGNFDLSAGIPSGQPTQTFTSTGTLSGMEVTLDTTFSLTAAITSAVSTNTETTEQGADITGEFSLATDLLGVQTISMEGATADDFITLAFDASTGVLTVTDVTSSNAGTINIGTTGNNGVQNFSIATGVLAGTIVTIDTDTFDFTATFDTASNANVATKSGGSTSRELTSAATTMTAGALRQLSTAAVANFVFTITQTAGANDTIVLNSGPAGWTVTSPSTTGDLSGGNVTVTFNKGGESFTALVTASGNVADTDTLQVTLALNELKNKFAVEDGNLDINNATAPVLVNLDATDLAALSTTTIELNIDSRGRAYMASGPTGFTVDLAASDDLATAGVRDIVLTNGTRNFTVQLDVTTEMSANGGSSDVTINLLALQNQFGLGTPVAGNTYGATIQVFDSLGNAHDLELSFTKVGTNRWEVVANDPVLASTGVTSGTVTTATRRIFFNGDGTPSNIIFPPIAITGWTTGANDATVAINIGTANQVDGVTQFAGEFSISSIDQDGVRFGSFTGVSIGEDGKVTALFDNGEQREIYQLPIAMFANPNGLGTRSGNAYSQTDKSGDILLQSAYSGGAGVVASSALEASTVDLAEEFTKMITTQRAYSASARIITTADEMLEELIRIRR